MHPSGALVNQVLKADDQTRILVPALWVDQGGLGVLEATLHALAIFQNPERSFGVSL